MLTRLPSLQHLSIFADPSDDITLSLLFSHPAMLAIAPRLRSFGWRLRASPPSALREFDNSTMYVSIQGWLRECTRLGFLVLDSDIEKEGVREVDLERVLGCLGEGREKTVRRREREARREMRASRVSRRDSGRTGDVNLGKRKFGEENGDAEVAKRPRSTRQRFNITPRFPGISTAAARRGYRYETEQLVSDAVRPDPGLDAHPRSGDMGRGKHGRSSELDDGYESKGLCESR
jgi:hypothetical protein